MKIYMMGICGTAMASLAGLLQDMGHEVRGSDQNVYPPMSDMLKDLKIEVSEGYKPENLHPRPDLVIVGNVMSRNHPEVQALIDSKIPFTSLASCIGEKIIDHRDSYVVAGTHGKSTTTSLLTWVMECLKQEPGFLVGAIPLNFNKSFRAPKKECFVIEGDEYDTAYFDKVPKFIHYRPKYVILNSIEFDHADIYKDLDAVKDAFKMLLDRIPEQGKLLYLKSDENIQSILKEYPQIDAKSFGEDGDYNFSDVEFHKSGTKFQFNTPDGNTYQVNSPLYGEFNVWNVLSVLSMVHLRAFDMSLALKAIESFKGLKRRQELIAENEKTKVIEDFAHHPSAVQLLLDGMSKSFHEEKKICFFEPRSATSRRNIFQNEYVKAFAKADCVFIKQAFDQSKIADTERLDTNQLVDDIKAMGVEAFYFSDLEEIWQEFESQLTDKNLVLIMSNGAFDGIYQKIKGHI
ncbi:MAG: Mur ligase family protein [Bdellovibrionota bacterium]|nr:Mur ligase family protein [Bdellovibrionota bacterium]